MRSTTRYFSVFVIIVSAVLIVSSIFAGAVQPIGATENSIDRSSEIDRRSEPPAPPVDVEVHHYSRVGEKGDLSYDVWETEYADEGLDIYYPTEDTEEGYPGLAYGHGTSMDRTEFQTWGEYYASRGYVTAVPDLPGFSGDDSAYHLLGVLDFLIENTDETDSPIEGKIDVDRMALAGFSAGGDASLKAAQLDAEDVVGAITPKAPAMYADPVPIPMDSEMQGETSAENLLDFDPDQIDIPVQLQAGNKDQIAPPEETPEQIYEELQDSPAQYTLIDGANHNQFGDVSPRGGSMDDFDGEPEISREEQHRISRRYSTSYFNYHLKGEEVFGEYLYGIFDELEGDVLEKNRYKEEDHSSPEQIEGLEDNLIAWRASEDDPDDVGHYNIYRSEGPTGPWDEPLEQIEATGNTTYTYTDNEAGDADDTAWWYLVRSVSPDDIEEENEDAVQEPGGVSGPVPPSDPEPGDDAAGVSVEADLSVYVEHEEGEEMDITFYDASDDSSIGTERVGSGERAATVWSGLEYESTYGWYAEADDGEITARSSVWSFTTEEALDEYDLTINVLGEGSTEPSEGTHTYEEGESVTVTAAADDGWSFEEWTDDVESTEDEITITMDNDKQITAVFEELTYHTLTVNVEGDGSVEIDPDKVEYEEGTEVTLTAVAHENWYFDQWTEDYESEEEEITIQMYEDMAITANFGPYEYDLIIGIEGEGTTSPPVGTHTYDYGEEVTIEADPNEGWYFEEWTGDHTGTEEEITIEMDGDKSVTAHFAIYEYELDLSVVGEGRIERDPEREVYEHGTDVELTATSDEEWYLEEWTGDVEDTIDEISVTMDEDKEITAHFAIYEYDLDLSVEGEGRIERDPEEEVYEHGTEVELVAVPEDDWYFDGWTGDTEGTDEETTLTMDENKGITANFEKYDPAHFEVEIIDYTEEAEEGEEFSIEYQVKNTGELEGTQDIILTLGGEEITREPSLTLAPGEEFKGEFVIDAVGTGEQELEIASNDESSTGAMTISEDGFSSNYWGVLLILLIGVIAAVVLIFMIKDRAEEDEKRTPKPPEKTSRPAEKTHQHPAKKASPPEKKFQHPAGKAASSEQSEDE